MIERLSKVLAKAGVASRRKCEAIITQGRVRVNGKKVIIPKTQIEEKEMITLDGSIINQEEEKVYFILNKPRGYHCSPIGKLPSKQVLELFSDQPYRLFTVGRLDKNSLGLLIITNDGPFCHKVIHPSSNIQKDYIVKTNKEITENHLKVISEGVYVEGDHIKPLRVKKIRKGTLKITVKEGKKHEVRHLVRKAGLIILELKRIRIGGLLLGKLPVGCWKKMTKKEKEAIFA